MVIASLLRNTICRYVVNGDLGDLVVFGGVIIGTTLSAEHLRKEVRCSYFHLWTKFLGLKMSRQIRTLLWYCLLCCTICFYLSDLLTKSYDVTIKMKPLEQWYQLVLFVLLHFTKTEISVFFLNLSRGRIVEGEWLVATFYDVLNL